MDRVGRPPVATLSTTCQDRLGEVPHKAPRSFNILFLLLRTAHQLKLLWHKCSCVAGTALCNHSVALLYQTTKYSTLQLKAVPPVLSCTETEQLRHTPRRLGVKPGRVINMVFISTKPKARQYTAADGVRQGCQIQTY
ncbi:hypothetical protein N1851_020431 [Merluccius polli]|uniref:SWIM-type domain-containing protein n=1 Tax=Merluccius polli TaxID=89951 RepID=A0AA47MKR4_MERPO|nr:hypothetical protein N1851_020431 [Merluccius polli]